MLFFFSYVFANYPNSSSVEIPEIENQLIGIGQLENIY